MKSGEILTAIDNTLDQLIKNAEVMSNAEKKELSSIEIESFEKTQESLLAKLLYIDEQLSEKTELLNIKKRTAPSYKIQEKLQYFQKLNDRFTTVKLRPIIRKVRKKSLRKKLKT